MYFSSSSSLVSREWFIQDLLYIHDQFIGVVQDQFSGHPLFQKALKDSFVEVVNRDAGRYKTSDLLSSFCDRILKTGEYFPLCTDVITP
jgi:cullin 1